jgi:hypothetical protein
LTYLLQLSFFLISSQESIKTWSYLSVLSTY